ncbi:MAG: respiratory nitrate reductase subunit gamma [Rhodomicrobium sp.]
MDYLNQLLFGYYPYFCLTVFLAGSLIRFEREQYTWRASSSQILRKKQLLWGSNLFHIGILFLLAGHFVGLLTPHALYEHVISAPDKQMLAIISGGIAGTVCFIGLTLLLQRRLSDSRIRKTSTPMDIAVLAILWVQLALGLMTLPFSLEHSDGTVMLQLSEWAQRIVTFREGAAGTIQGLAWPYQLHLVLGMTVFLIFPFSRLVHIWSAPVGYLGRRGWQIVRTNRQKPA